MFTRKLGWSLLLMAVLVSLPAFGAANDEVVSGKCSLATLKGTFGTLEQGTVVGQLPGLPAPPWPAANVAIVTYDGAGNFSGSYTASFNGVTATGTFTGTYTVNADCTYSDQFTPSPLGVTFHHTGVISGGPQFRKVSYIYTDSTLVSWGVLKKTPPCRCSLATLKGNYVAAAQGTITGQMPGLPPPPFPAVHSTFFTADGAGNYSGNGTINLDGYVLPLPFTATYTVNSDCTFSAVVSNPYGGSHLTGVITGVGMFQQVRLIFTDPNEVYVAEWSKQ